MYSGTAKYLLNRKYSAVFVLHSQLRWLSDKEGESFHKQMLALSGHSVKKTIWNFKTIGDTQNQNQNQFGLEFIDIEFNYIHFGIKN
jgi:hypothetical protein